ncbi:hypothetical protein ACFQZ4_53890 [Catellatospora coxensis]|uniref:Uncharacterized protein n=1 Tax=Catellatospora coxensis TaxID=310354 RepID=A0A8J3L168_9ACTN|nr:hypothetical protein [Catellatospora coxensis]GIG05860.1 hypothetical protein Cco03nite_25600 [Catellatospora coxensis]
MFENLGIPEILLLFAATTLLIVGLAFLGGRAFARRRTPGRTPE